jgi:hypothetical protein
MIDIVVALLVLPFFLTIALLLGLIFGLVGGWASAIVAAWPILLFYHDRYLLMFVPSNWTFGAIRRVQAYVDFYSDTDSPRTPPG